MSDQELLKEIHRAISDALEDWEAADSPEAFIYDMKHLMTLRDRIAARLRLT